MEYCEVRLCLQSHGSPLKESWLSDCQLELCMQVTAILVESANDGGLKILTEVKKVG